MKRHYLMINVLLFFALLVVLFSLPRTAQTVNESDSVKLAKNFTINQTARNRLVEDTINLKIWLTRFDSTQALVLTGNGLANETPLGGSPVRANAASLFDSDIAYYLTIDRRVWKTTDGGDSFAALTSFDNILASSDPDSEGTPVNIFTDPAAPNRVWVLVTSPTTISVCGLSV